jgi:hypothetical protein
MHVAHTGSSLALEQQRTAGVAMHFDEVSTLGAEPARPTSAKTRCSAASVMLMNVLGLSFSLYLSA